MPFEKGDPRARKGWARMQQIAAEDKIEVDKIAADLVAGLGRRPFPADRLMAEHIAAADVKARRLRSQGKDDSAERAIFVKLISMWPAPTAMQLQGLSPEESRRFFEREDDPVADAELRLDIAMRGTPKSCA